ncbi:MAG: TolC family protein [Deltaproteobacteria bacterium]|nr:TolC family protein [Deltaproteobacteria bacterium]
MKRSLATSLIWALVALAGPGAAAWAGPTLPPPPRFTLEQLVDLALERSPSLGVERGRVEASAAQVTQARAGYLPQLNARLGYDRVYSNRQSTFYRTTTSLTSGSSGGAQDDYQSSVSLTQNLYDFGRTSGRLAQSRHNLEISRKGLVATAADLVRDVKAGYFEVLKQEELVQVEEENLTSQEKHLEQAEALFRQGLRPKIDVTKGQSEVSKARLTLLQTRYDLRRARVDLERLLGGPPAPGGYTLAPAGPSPSLPDQVEPLVARALILRPEVAQQRAQIAASLAGLRAAQGGHWPNLNAVGNYGYEGSEFPLSEGWTAGVVLSWDFFTGLRTTGEVDQAKAVINQAASSLQLQDLVVTEEVTKAYLALHEADQAIVTARVGLAQAQENLNQAQGRYQAGVGDSLEFNDAQVLYTQAKSALVQASYILLQAWAELERSVGETARAMTAEFTAQAGSTTMGSK